MPANRLRKREVHCRLLDDEHDLIIRAVEILKEKNDHKLSGLINKNIFITNAAIRAAKEILKKAGKI